MLLAKIKKFAARCAAGMQSSDRLDPSVFDPMKTRVRRDKTVGEAFFELVEKYGLIGKAALNVQKYDGHHFRLIAILPDASYKWTTARLIKTGTVDFFPPGFVKEMKDLTARYQTTIRRTRGGWQEVTFEIHPTGITLKEMQEEQAAWTARCEAMWGDA